VQQHQEHVQVEDNEQGEPHRDLDSPDFCHRHDDPVEYSPEVLASIPSIRRARIAVENAREMVLAAARDSTVAPTLCGEVERGAAEAHASAMYAWGVENVMDMLGEEDMQEFVERMKSLPLDTTSSVATLSHTHRQLY
jgi:hypothetical protein